MRRGGGDLAAQTQRVAAVAPRIVYTPLWTELFSTMLEVFAEGTLTAQQGLDILADDSRGEEVRMFREVYGDVLRHAAGR